MSITTLARSLITLPFLLFNGVTNSAEKITVAFGEILAPWVLTENDKGIIIDIFEAAMTPLGYEVEHLYLPYARRTLAYRTGDVDVVSDMNLNTINEYELTGFFSDTAYSYENFAFSLHKNQYKFTQLSELSKHSLLSWQDAKIHLGGDYAKMANNNPNYGETHDQTIQVKMLFLGRYEVIQMDSHIFDYYRAKMLGMDNIDLSQKVDRFALFGASPNGFLFKSEKMRNQFNQQLLKLKSTGQYQEIFDRYLQ